MSITLNALLDRVEPSKSVTLLQKVKELQAKDPGILNLTAGEPDFATPRPIVDEAYRQMLSGCTHYGDSRGDAGLRAAIAEKLLTDNHAPYQPDNILVTPGGKYSIYVAIQALLNPGDEAIWLSPGWVSYPAIITLCGGTPVEVALPYEKNYAITREQLEAHTTARTRLLIINYPNNPTGRVLTEADFAELKAYLLAHPGVMLLSDEIYEKLVYGGITSVSPAGDPDLFERVITVNGFSKCSAMTGWRIGYLACSPALYPAVLKIFQHAMSCTSSFVQKGAIAALAHPEETEAMRVAYEHRRDIVHEGLKDLPGVEFLLPDGAFYAWVRFDTAMGAEALSLKLLEKARIGGVPGSAYGTGCEQMMRFCFAKDDATLNEFVARMRRFCAEEL